MVKVIATGAPPITCAGCTSIVNGGGVGVIDRFAATVGDTMIVLLVPSEMAGAIVRTEPSARPNCWRLLRFSPTLIVTERRLAVVWVVILKSCRSTFAGTVIDGGTVASLVFADNGITRPPGGAFPVSTIVPIEPLPPGTDPGFRSSLLGAAARIVRVAVGTIVDSPKAMVLLVPSEMPDLSEASLTVAARRVTEVSIGTGFVVTTNVVDDAPGATITD